MNIGLVGSGGREHAIAKALTNNQARDRLIVFGSSRNPGIEGIATYYEVGSINNAAKVVSFFKEHPVDMVVIGPEAPLMSGVADALRAAGVAVVGPNQKQAQLEGSKAFMRDLLQRRVGWGSPRWQYVQDMQQVKKFIDENGQIVIKPVGLTGGKGVRVMGVHLQNADEAAAEAKRWIDADGGVLLEERLLGEEFSRMSFISDGVIAPLPLAQDFKYAYDGDQGGMTGGMGSYTMPGGSMPFVEPSDLSDADRLIREVVSALEEESGARYRGFLYGQFMVTCKGVRIIEFNVRLGDPEAINEMALLESDAPLIFEQMASGHLKRDDVVFSKQASLCKYLVPTGYPDVKDEGTLFNLDENEIIKAGFDLICSSVARKGEQWETLGSRTLAVVGLGTHPGEISTRMEALLSRIEPDVLRHRRDVGAAEVIEAKTKHMQMLRSAKI